MGVMCFLSLSFPNLCGVQTVLALSGEWGEQSAKNYDFNAITHKHANSVRSIVNAFTKSDFL